MAERYPSQKLPTQHEKQLTEEDLEQVTGGATVQEEATQSNFVSNVLKTRHDTAKNSIAN
jgi:bacteriocin-like protein